MYTTIRAVNGFRHANTISGKAEPRVKPSGTFVVPEHIQRKRRFTSLRSPPLRLTKRSRSDASPSKLGMDKYFVYVCRMRARRRIFAEPQIAHRLAFFDTFQCEQMVPRCLMLQGQQFVNRVNRKRPSV
jgi:hypothetical protein